MDAAATCLHNLCQRRQEHLSEVEQRQELIESQFLKVCPSIAAEMSVWATTPGSTCARSAQKAYLEYTVMKWVQTENVMHGHAPSTDLIMEYRRHLAGQWERPSSGLSTLEPAADLHSHEHTTNRCWAARFRLRWGGRMARIRLREPMAEEVALQKAARRIHKMQSTGRSLWDPLGQAKRSRMGPMQQKCLCRRAPKTVPERVPEIASIARPLRRLPRGSGRTTSRRKFHTAKRLCTSTWTRLP